MQIVTEIPDEVYDVLMGKQDFANIDLFSTLIQAVQLGTPLPKGHWIDTNYHQYYNDGDIETTELRCSCCNEEVEWDIELLHKPYYCENCGADMREVEE